MALTRAEISKRYRLRKIEESGDKDYWKNYQSQWRKENPSSINELQIKREYNKKRYKENRKEINLKRKRNNLTPEQLMIEREKRRQYYENNPNANIAAIYRDRILNALKKKGLKKTFRSYDMLGCNWNELISYIESKFKEGMTWENHGRGEHKWHLDHKIPCSFFDLSNYEEIKKCFHYTNMQPLWEIENLNKLDSIPQEYKDGKLLWDNEKGWILKDS